MKKILLIIVLIAIVAGGIHQYMRINTYSYHLDKAEVALNRIDALLQGGSPTAFIPTVYAQNGGLDETAIARDADTAIDEIGAAQNIVNDMSDDAKQEGAQNDIDETKGHAESTLDAASEAVEGDDVKTVISEAQESLDNIEAGKEYNSDARTNFDESYDPNEDPNMRADRSNEDDDEDDDENDEIENEAPIDEAEGTNANDDSAVNDNNDTNYGAAEADATERYQPYLDWEYGDPVPLEDQKQLDKDTAETPTIDPALMQDAINKMMEQQ